MKKTVTFCAELEQAGPIPLQVHLHCAAGELMGLTGPSGSGKSTVLRIIAGLQTCFRGKIVCGSDTWMDTSCHIYRKPQQRRVGFVFQHYALFPHKSVMQNIQLAMQQIPASQRAERAQHWLSLTNMEGLELRKPDSLSGGQRQRVALARALAREPSLLLLDEPFSAVDQQTRRKLYRELATLRKHLNIPIILVTHDLQEVQQLADSLCVLHRGHSLQQGSVQEVISRPANRNIAKLLGHQNLFAARVESHEQNFTRFRLSPQHLLYGERCHFNVGRTVTLLIGPSAITLYSAEKNVPVGGPTDALEATRPQSSPLLGTIRDIVGLGDQLSLRVHLDTIPKSLRINLPSHVAQKHFLGEQTRVTVNIQPSGIYAMPSNP